MFTVSLKSFVAGAEGQEANPLVAVLGYRAGTQSWRRSDTDKGLPTAAPAEGKAKLFATAKLVKGRPRPARRVPAPGCTTNVTKYHIELVVVKEGF